MKFAARRSRILSYVVAICAMLGGAAAALALSTHRAEASAFAGVPRTFRSYHHPQRTPSDLLVQLALTWLQLVGTAAAMPRRPGKLPLRQRQRAPASRMLRVPRALLPWRLRRL